MATPSTRASQRCFWSKSQYNTKYLRLKASPYLITVQQPQSWVFPTYSLFPLASGLQRSLISVREWFTTVPSLVSEAFSWIVGKAAKTPFSFHRVKPVAAVSQRTAWLVGCSGFHFGHSPVFRPLRCFLQLMYSRSVITPISGACCARK